MSSPQWEDVLRQVFSVVKKRCGFGGGSKGFRAPAKRGFQRLGTAAWKGGDGRVEAERRVAHWRSRSPHVARFSLLDARVSRVGRCWDRIGGFGPV